LWRVREDDDMTVEELVAQGYSREAAERVAASLAELPPDDDIEELRFMREFG